jgi:transposase
LGTLNEYQARLFVAERALRTGRGGMSQLARLTGMSRVTITKGIAELRAGRALVPAAVGRVRQPGAGRPRVVDVDLQLRRQLTRILEQTTAGDPMSLLKWTSKSTRTLAEELTRRGHPVSASTVARGLRELGYSLQANVKAIEASAPRPGRPVPVSQRAGEGISAHQRSRRVGGHEEEGVDWDVSERGPDVAPPWATPPGVHPRLPASRGGKAIPYGTYDIA